MAKLAGSERLAWKSKLDESDWVDSTPWLDDEGRTETDPQIEFLEAEPSAYRLSSSVLKSRQGAESERAESQWAKIVGIGAVAVVLIALAIMSQPGDNDPFNQLPPQEQQIIRQRQAREAREAAGLPADEPVDEVAAPDVAEPTPASEDDPELAAAEAEGAASPRVLGPIPPLRQDLPPTFTGPLFAYGFDGSLVLIDPTEDTPQEIVVEMAPSAKATSQGVDLGSAFAVQGDDSLWRFAFDGSLIDAAGLSGGEIVPADEGALVGIRGRSNAQVATLLTAESDYQESDSSLRWEIGGDLDVLGAWRSRLLVAKAGKVWLLTEDNRYESVSEGQVLSYDGRHLAMLNCAAPNDCRIQVGTPSQPRQRSVAVTEDLATLSLDAWTHSVAVSPDGSRIAFNHDRGAVALPIWIDMVTGEQQAVPDSMNHSSPLAWSPDGQWLAYAFTDDVVVWSIEDRRAWRIMTNRAVNHLGWPESDGDLEQGVDTEE